MANVKKKAIEKITHAKAETKAVCTVCEGVGVDRNVSDTELCKVCQGSGTVTVQAQ